MRFPWLLLPVPVFVLLSACANSSNGVKKGKPTLDASKAAAGSMEGIQAFNRQLQGDEGTPIKPVGDMTKVPIGGQYADNEVVWTNPDDPDASIPMLGDLFKEASKIRGPWEASETLALREAKTAGKPLLIWFTNSAAPIVDKPIGELLNREDFEKWAKENLVRLRVDQSPTGSTVRETDARKIYEQRIKERYKVTGYPTLLLLTPSGEVAGRYTGYKKGQSDFKWGQLKQGTKIAQDNYQKQRTDLAKKGYRDWSDGKGRSIFARLAGYRDGDMVLIEPDGTRARTNEKHLSDTDRDWIQAEKQKRGIQ